MIKLTLSTFLLGLAGATLAQSQFTSLDDDGIHDSQAPGLPLLQEPQEALGQLPMDQYGNPDWVSALQQGYIKPRTGVTGTEKMQPINLDIIMKNTASMPHVRFSHKTHTQWLTCSNCHTRIFLPQLGGNFITMAGIIEGQHCGVCHGKVAFTYLDCARCHDQGPLQTGLR